MVYWCPAPAEISCPSLFKTNDSLPSQKQLVVFLRGIKQTDLKDIHFQIDEDGTDDRGKGVPSFDEMMDFALVEVDFDDPTTNVR